MANKKFSQFELKTDQADVDFLVGYTGTENVKIASEKVGNRRGSVYTVTGTLQNMFGGNPGIFGDTVEFGISASPASNSSSVLIIPVDVKLIGISYKWISQTALTGIGASDLYQIKVLPMSNTSGPTTGTGNYDTTIAPIVGLDLTSADNGTFPFRSAVTDIVLSAGSIINVSGIESSGNIPSTDAEVEVVLTFEITSF